MQSEQGYVETIQAEHVLTAMKQMGWQPGQKTPGYAAIQARLRQLFGNGGDGNRMRELREAAIRLASGQPVSDDEQERTDLPPLPDEIQQELVAIATAFEQQLTRLDRRLAKRLDSTMSEINADARIKIDAIRRDAETRLATAHEELDQALTELQTAVVSISNLQSDLSASRETTARIGGRLEVLEQELVEKVGRISSLETELAKTHAEIATSLGRMETLESDLHTKIKQVESLDVSLAESRESTATATSRVQSLENELKSRKEEVQSLRVELASSKETSARNSGLLEALEQDLAAKANRLTDLEAKLAETTTAMATAIGRADVLEKELSAVRSVVEPAKKVGRRNE